jgi:hypothetical protein
MKDGLQHTINSFPELASLGVSHFQTIYKESDRENIVDILKLTSNFPRFVLEEDNNMMVEEIPKEELKSVLASFKKEIPQDSMGDLLSSL